MSHRFDEPGLHALDETAGALQVYESAQELAGLGRGAGAPQAVPAKLIAPQSADSLARPRLFQALDDLSQKPVVWIHAPAGAGKTTLLASYVSARDVQTLWYDIDAGDRDPNELYQCLRIGAEKLVEAPLSQETARPGPPNAQRAFARRFFRSLTAALPERTLLVFDSYEHVADDAVWDDILRELCSVLPAHVRLMIASRVAPPKSLARWCGSGELAILDFEHLRFDEQEIEKFLKSGARQRRRTQATVDKNSAELLALSGGWAVAVALLSRSTSLATPVKPSARTVSGELRRAPESDETLFQFMVSELFERLEREHRGLLLKLAFLPHFTAEMAASLTQRDDAIALLRELYTDHLLVEKHGDQRFRLHDLFRAFLLRYAHGSYTVDGWRDTSLQAAELLIADHQFAAGVDLLSSVRAWNVLGDAIVRYAPVLAAGARLETLASALARLPEEHRQSRPWLVFWQAVVTLGRPGEPSLELAEQAFEQFRACGDVAGTLLAWSLVVQAIVIQGENFRRLHTWLTTLANLGLEPPGPPIAVQVALSTVLAHSFSQVGTRKSLEAADRAVEVVSRFGTAEDRVQVGGAALLTYFIGGHFVRADDMRRLARAELPQGADNPLAELSYLHSEAILEMSSANFRKVEHAVQQGVALAETSGIDAWTGSLKMLGVLAAIACNELTRAETLLNEVSVGVAGAPRLAQSQYSYGRAWLAFERDEIETALRWIQDCIRDNQNLGFEFGRYQEALALVIFTGTQADASAFDAAVSRLDDCVKASDSAWFAAAAELAKTYGSMCLGRDAVDRLRSAFRQARQVGMKNPAFLGSRAVRKLVTSALDHDIEPEFVTRLLHAYEFRPGPEALAIASWPWPIKLRTLGQLGVEIDGKAHVFGRKTPTALLALLKVLAGASEPLPAARLTNLLWPGYGAASARGSLDTALYRLRKLLTNEAAIESINGNIGLALQICWSDVRALTACCDRIAELRAGTSLETLDKLSRHLLDLYRGPFGAEDDPPFVARTRETLRRRFARAVRHLRRAFLEHGERERADNLVHVALSRDEQAQISESS